MTRNSAPYAAALVLAPALTFCTLYNIVFEGGREHLAACAISAVLVAMIVVITYVIFGYDIDLAMASGASMTQTQKKRRRVDGKLMMKNV